MSDQVEIPTSLPTLSAVDIGVAQPSPAQKSSWFIKSYFTSSSFLSADATLFVPLTVSLSHLSETAVLFIPLTALPKFYNDHPYKCDCWDNCIEDITQKF